MKPAIIPLILFLGLSISARSANSQQMPVFELEPSTVVFDKNDPKYVDYPVPQSEKDITHDFRNVDLDAKVYGKKERPIILPAEYPHPRSPFESLANFLKIAKTKDFPRVAALHDSASRGFVDSALRIETNALSFLQTYEPVTAAEIWGAFRAKGICLLYCRFTMEGKNKEKTKSFSPMFFRVEKGEYKMIGGLIDIGYIQDLCRLLMEEKLEVIKKSSKPGR